MLELDDDAIICGGREIRSPWNVNVGKSTVGSDCILDGRYGIVIKDSACLGVGVHIWTAQHDVQDADFETEGKCGKVIIEKYVWLASNSTVLPMITIKEGSVLASGGIATQDIEAYTINAGIPARIVGYRTRYLCYKCGKKQNIGNSIK